MQPPHVIFIDLTYGILVISESYGVPEVYIGCALTQRSQSRQVAGVCLIHQRHFSPGPGHYGGLLPMTFQTCSHGKHVHMNENNIDGTDSPSNKITWMSCSSYYAITSSKFYLTHKFEREFKFLGLLTH